MKSPDISMLPTPPAGRNGWPWNEADEMLPEKMPNGAAWPRVSLVIPSYNQGCYIEEALRAALLQGYPDLELIVVDGGSTDGTLEIISKYGKWVSYWESEPDRGQSHAINKGLARCTGKYFNWNNTDDVLTKGSLAQTVLALEENPEAGGVTGYVVIIDSESTVVSINDDHPLLKGRSGFLHDVERCIEGLKCGCQPGGLLNRELVVRAGGIDEDIHYAMDVDLFLRVMIHKPIYHIDFPVIMFRMHPASKTSTWVKGRARERLKMAQKLFADPCLPQQLRAIKLKTFASAHRSAADYCIVNRRPFRAAWHTVCRGGLITAARAVEYVSSQKRKQSAIQWE